MAKKNRFFKVENVKHSEQKKCTNKSNYNITICQNQIKSSLYSPHYAEACNESRGPSPRLSAWASQLRRNVATVASRWRHCVDLTGPGIEPQTSRTDSVRLATELTAGQIKYSLYSPYYAEACNELRGPSPRLSAWATQLRRNVATVANRWRHCADLTSPGIEPLTSRTDSVR